VQKKFWRPVTLIRQQKNFFCSHTCADNFLKSPKTLHVCANCGKEFTLNEYRTKRKQATPHRFCSRKCKDEAQCIGGTCPELTPQYKNGIHIYRKWAFAHYPHECAHCGWKKYPKILVVHHLDRDRKNNKIENLMILCPTCHAFDTWGVGIFKWIKEKCIFIIK